MLTNSIDHILTEIEGLKSTNNYAKARKVAQGGLLSHTDDYRLYEELADIALFEEKLDEAEHMIEMARGLHPESGTGLYLEGYIAVARADYPKAIKTLTEANKLFPNNPEILRNLGWAYSLSGEFDKGILLLRRAVQIMPDDPLIVNDLGIALIAKGDIEEGEKLLASIENK